PFRECGESSRSIRSRSKLFESIRSGRVPQIPIAIFRFSWSRRGRWGRGQRFGNPANIQGAAGGLINFNYDPLQALMAFGHAETLGGVSQKTFDNWVNLAA